jgi:hypothetical protein
MNEKIKSILEQCFSYVEDWAKEECDHNFAICYCADKDLLEEIKTLLKEDQSGIIKQQLNQTFSKAKKVAAKTRV